MVIQMEIFIKLKKYIISTLDNGSLGLSLIEIFIIFSFFVLALVIREIFAKTIVTKIKKIINKTGNKVDDDLFNALAPPLKTLPIILVFILMGLFINTDSYLGVILENLNQTLVTIFVFWILHQSLVPLSQAFQKLEELLSKALVLWLVRSLKYLIIFLGVVAVLETWGIKIGPVIAGLGLFGVAVALGAQDLFKNLISGIMIILEKRFELNDVIEVPGHATGTVEHIGFRSTVIRQFDSTPISIPNYVFSDTSIINFSDRQYRRINWIIGLTYETSVKQLKDICKSINDSIHSSNNFIISDAYKLFVRVEKFNDSSIDILIYTFTNTNDWEKYLKIKEELVFIIKDIVEKNNSSFAFPSQSIFIEKNSNDF
jgi:MscS family membrane protein